MQCINGMPKVKDRSNSFYRRQLVIPFLKNFQDSERKYIKDDYIGRKDVLEYVLWRVLNMDYYELSEPEACKHMLLEYKEVNDPVRQFWAEMEGQFSWHLLPYRFLYDLYCAWAKENCPDAENIGKKQFTNDIMEVAKNSRDWYVPPKVYEKTSNMMRPPLIRTGYLMDGGEMLVKEYGLGRWQNKNYNGLNEDIRYRPSNLSCSYRGILARPDAISKGYLSPDGIPRPYSKDVGAALDAESCGPEPEPEPG